ncbi:probable ATP-dependent RNA helicase DDX27 [Pollicipes pollicipes]|uniref:probable ATP-dependent RNA helicase DDX27 n=1 Tax=Pollicipes pollicipes TaxID=41117 RepID=UPI0018850C05|nr:probable ATP-dependent RNA helicase DDX27 [Pollicipes pollicipes]
MDFVRTIDSDDELDNVSVSSSGDDKDAQHDPYFAEDFEFGETFEEYNLDPWQDIQKYLKKKRLSNTDQKIAQVLDKGKHEESLNQDEAMEEGESDSAANTNADDDGEESASEEDNVEELGDNIRVKEAERRRKEKKLGRRQTELAAEAAEAARFFSEVTGDTLGAVSTFHEMNLSRPLLKAVTALEYVHPTPIQAATIPVALLGRDICGCAATGTGKTAAFMLPILERLVFKPKQIPVTRVLVLVPTRELGVQVYQVTRQLSQFVPTMQVALAAGGMDIKVQEAQLRQHPDIVIATPGRLIDHLQNTQSFCLDTVEVLVLDEADRMLDEYFAEQMGEIIKQCAATRQTMLFSATMTDDVKQLAAVSLKDPVKVFVNENTDVAANLKQEFVRIRPGRQGDREALLAGLLLRTFHDRVMVFVQTKRQTHRLHIVLGLLGVRVGELHGDLSQAQRLESLRRFREQEIDVLLATDVAARGLDIPDVKTVINFTMPATSQQYVHRVGRTARAGRAGRSVSMAGETERAMIREISRRSLRPVEIRTVPQAVADRYRLRIERLEAQVDEVFRLEREERELRNSEAQLTKAERQLTTQQERPRTWFQSQQQRAKAKQAAKLEVGDEGSAKAKKKKKRKEVTAEQRVEKELQKRYLLQAKAAKRASRRAGGPGATPVPVKKKKAKGGKKGLNLTAELTDTSQRAVKGYRHRATESLRERAAEKRGGGRGRGRGRGGRLRRV